MKTCLVVDDSPTVRKIARRLLEPLGLVVDEAEDGRVALGKCQARMPEAILLDWNMPHMTGIEFLRALRKLAGGTAPAVILCTTEGDVDHIRQAIDAGASEYIVKPFDGTMLRQKLDTVIGLPPIV